MRWTLAFALLSCASTALAQNAQVSGRVTDPSQAVIPNAKVEIVNRATAVRTPTATNAEGYFVFPPLLPGSYDLAASAPGFTSARLDNLTLEVGQTRAINLQLQTGEVNGYGVLPERVGTGAGVCRGH